MVNQIEQMLVEAWEKFCDYYDTKATEYAQIEYNRLCNECNYKEEKAKKELEKNHWICWNESDLMVHLGRYFYRQRDKKSVSDKELLNIEMHFDKNLNRTNFNGYSFAKELDALKKELGRTPKLDLIITREDNYGPFLLCAEAKCFHTSVRGGVDKAIEKDIETLSAIRKKGITKKIAYIIFDDYYYLRKRSKKDVEKIVADIIKKKGIENGITVLFHTSEAKLENY